MPTRLKEAENQKKEEEAMAATMLQQEKEAAGRQQKEDNVRTTPAADTPSIPPQPDAPPISSAINLNLWTSRTRRFGNEC
jgi:hypothetical protein